MEVLSRLKIGVRRWVAVWYRCPKCGKQTAFTMLSPWLYRYLSLQECSSWKCNRFALEVVERRWYTTFCIETGVSFATITGTLEMIGPFRVWNMVHRDIRAFKRWYRRRKAEEAEKTRLHLEYQRQVEAEWRARRERQRPEAAVLKEIEKGAYRREHAVELVAEKVARAVWPGEEIRRQAGNEDDFDPFLDADELF